MKCRAKDCKDCVHFIDIRTHSLFRNFIMKDESGKTVDFQGCIDHLKILFLRQIWIRLIGTQAAVEKRGDDTKDAVQQLVGIAMGNIMLADQQRKIPYGQ